MSETGQRPRYSHLGTDLAKTVQLRILECGPCVERPTSSGWLFEGVTTSTLLGVGCIQICIYMCIYICSDPEAYVWVLLCSCFGEYLGGVDKTDKLEWIGHYS